MPPDVFVAPAGGLPVTVSDREFARALEAIRLARCVDLGSYKRPLVERAILRRVALRGLSNPQAYADLVQREPAEIGALFDTLLPPATTFFRDAQAWRFVASNVIPALLRRAGSERPIAVWSAGCASGQEVWALAILLAQALGPAEFARRVSIVGSDVDEPVLAVARRARFRPHRLSGIPAHLQRRYFETIGEDLRPVELLRDAVEFERHDLTSDPPLSDVDLIACRNCLMYFTAQTQSAVLDRLRSGLRDGGVLFLGRGETPGRVDQLSARSIRHRVFERRAADRSPSQERSVDSTRPPRSTIKAAITLDAEGALEYFDGSAQRLLGLGRTHLGLKVSELTLDDPCALAVLAEASSMQTPAGGVLRRTVEWPLDRDQARRFELRATSLATGQQGRGVLVRIAGSRRGRLRDGSSKGVAGSGRADQGCDGPRHVVFTVGERGAIALWSPQAELVFRRSAHEVRGKPVGELALTTPPQVISELIDDARSGNVAGHVSRPVTLSPHGPPCEPILASATADVVDDDHHGRSVMVLIDLHPSSSRPASTSSLGGTS